LVIDPPTTNPTDGMSFATSGTIGGTNAAELSLKPGDSKQITIDSGADVRVVSDVGVSWNAETNGTALGVKAISTTEWHVSLSSDTTSTTPVRLTVTLGSKTATLDITVNAQKYSPPQYKVGTQWNEQQQRTTSGNTISSGDPYSIISVNGDNSFVVQNQYGEQLRYKAGQEYYGWTNSAGSTRCDWTLPWDSIFPLYVGKKNGGSIKETCTDSGNPQWNITTTYDYTYEVLGVETLTIAGVKLKTLKLAETTRTTDIQLSGTTSASVGDLTTGTRWWSPDWGIFVQKIGDNTTATASTHIVSQVFSYKF